MKLRRINTLFIILGMMMILITACSTKKNKWNRRVYHNLTAHYNGYYNGQVSLKEAKVDIKEANKDDYTQILEVFQLASEDDIKTVFPKLDRSIMKASVVIHRHSMYFGKKENVKWVYYSYMMIGKARFYKHEYGIAKQVFQFVSTKYPKEDVKYDARMWIAKVQGIQGDYDAALSNLDGIKNKVRQGLTSKEVYKMLPMVYADIYIKSKNYEAAIPHLKEAIDRNHKKSDRARMLFILGQLQQKLNKLNVASKYFAKVLKNNPSYEMDFNARIKMAECYTGGDSREVYKQLNKMLKDPKNIDYQDQIYYALAQVALQEDKKDQAIDYLRSSVEASVSNDKQKAFSSLQLAGLFFDKKQYPNAQAYYDSTMMFLPKDYPEYDEINKLKITLTELVTNLIIVQTEDSLQYMASLSISERNKIVDEAIAKLINQERIEKEEERERQENLQFLETNRTGPRSVTQSGSAKWYFYNTSSLSAGRTEFMKKWGNRKLEDDWRMSNKTPTGAEDIGENLEGEDEEGRAQNGQDSIKRVISDNKTREYYLQNVPLTEELLDSSNARIEKALFSMGVIYKEKLRNYDEAIKVFEKLIDRFPKGYYTPQAYYHLYQLYDLEGINSEAKRYKNLLIKEYPDSDYAKILQDPNYFKKLAAEANKAREFYKKTYQLFLSGNYSQVKNNNEIAKASYPGKDDLLSKFEMLNALSIGKSSTDTVAFITALNVVVSKYPNSASKLLAEEIIKRLKQGSQTTNSVTPDATPDGNVAETRETIFVYNDTETHMFMVLADQRNVKISEMSNRISDHNRKYFALNGLKVSSLPINENMVLISVSQFKDKKEALDYFKTIKRNTVLYGMIKRIGGNYFVITNGNYSRLYKSKDLVGYRKFFERYYPEGK